MLSDSSTLMENFFHGGHIGARDWSAADKGRRLDHLWATPDISKLVTSVVIARDVRGWEQPSDHAPIFVVFDV